MVTIFGSVINENLSDEVIVTVIATGFDKAKKLQEQREKEKLAVPVVEEQSQPTRRVSRDSYNTEVLDNKSDSVESKYELPPFLRDNL